MKTFQGLYVISFLFGICLGTVGFFFGHINTMAIGILLMVPTTLLLFIVSEILGENNTPVGKNVSFDQMKKHKENRMIVLLIIFSTMAFAFGGGWQALALFWAILLVVSVSAYNYCTRSTQQAL